MNKNALEISKIELPRAPESFTSGFEALFNTGDIEQLMEIFEIEAVIHLQDGRTARGSSEIRSTLMYFLSFKVPIKVTEGFCVVNGDYALASSH